MQIYHYIQLARFPMSFLLSFFAVLVSYLYASNGQFNPEMLVPILAAVLGTGGMCAMNDYVDVEADKLGARDRPLPSGKISLKNGLMFAIVLTIAGMTIAGISNKISLPIIGGTAVLLGTSYNFKTKGRGFAGTINFGLIMVTVSLLGIAQITTELYHPKILLFCLFVFTTASCNQLSANFYDMKSDKTFGYHTIPNIYGIEKAAVLVTIFRLTSLAFLILFIIASGLFNFYLLAPFVVLTAMLIIAFHFLKQANDILKAKTGFKFGVIFTLLSFCTILLGIYL